MGKESSMDEIFSKDVVNESVREEGIPSAKGKGFKTDH